MTFNALDRFTPVLDWLLRTSWQSALLIGLVLVVQVALGARLSTRWRYALWLIVVVRLAMPVTLTSPISLFNLGWGNGERNTSRWVETVTYGPVPAGEGWNAKPRAAKSGSGAAPQRAPVTPWRVHHLLLVVWLIGLAVYVLAIAAVNVRGWRTVRGLLPTANPALLDLLITCRKEMGVRSAVRLVETDAVTGPALWGVFRPTILLPSQLAALLRPDELRWVLLHELAHVKRWDTAMNWLLIVLQGVHWFNPLVWLAFHRMRGDREMACDALVLERNVGDNASDYGRTILRILESAAHRGRLTPMPIPGAIAMAESIGQLQRRMRMIAQYRRPTRAGSLAGFALLLMLGCAGLTDKALDTPGPGEVLDAATLDWSVLEQRTPPHAILTIRYAIPHLEGLITADSQWTEFPFGSPEAPDEATLAAARERVLNDTADLIRETIDPQGWREDGGTVGSIEAAGTALIVRATRRNHREVWSLLDQLAEQRGIMINFETRFLLVHPDFFDEVGIDGNLNTGEAGSLINGQYLNDIQVDFLIRASRANRRGSLASPRITTFNGQEAFVTVTTQTAYVADVEVLKGNGGVNPTVKTVQSGVFVGVRGTVTADRKYVFVKVTPKLSQLHGFNEKRHPESPPDQPIIIEEPVLETMETQTTVSIPDRGTLMLNLGKTSVAFELEAGVPVLSKIPLLNRLTTNRSKVKDERIVLFLIKPVILDKEGPEEELFPGPAPEAERAPEARTQEEKEARVQTLLRRAANLRKELDYEQALEVLDEALALDPQSIIARAMKEMIEDSIVWRKLRELRRRQAIPVPPRAGELTPRRTTTLVIYPPVT